jgi:hypothetical protein
MASMARCFKLKDFIVVGMICWMAERADMNDYSKAMSLGYNWQMRSQNIVDS